MKLKLTLVRRVCDAPASHLRKAPDASRLKRPMKAIELTELGFISTAMICCCLGLEAFVTW